MKLFLSSLLFLWLDNSSVHGLSCPPPRSGPTDSPVCCTSGYMTKGVCGIRDVCAKAEGETCGGPWNSGGVCARNLQCQIPIKCTCYAKIESPFPRRLPRCIFPFKYDGVEYNSCTTANSENGKAWCAYEVDRNGVAVDGKWGDCSCKSCFSTNYDDGKCVKKKSKISGAIGLLKPSEPDSDNLPNRYDLRDGIVGGEKIKRCQTPAQQFQCRCADRSTCINVQESENATTTDYDYYGGGPDYGWCWLENLYDQNEPSSYCFNDAYYSRRHGRFYSSKACNPDEQPLEKEYKPNLDATQTVHDLLCDGPSKPPSCEEPPVVFDE